MEATLLVVEDPAAAEEEGEGAGWMAGTQQHTPESIPWDIISC
jgi:hypothetical protein